MERGWLEGLEDAGDAWYRREHSFMESATIKEVEVGLQFVFTAKSARGGGETGAGVGAPSIGTSLDNTNV